MAADEISRLVHALGGRPEESQAAKTRLIELGPPVVEPLIEVVNTQRGRPAWAAAEVLGYLGDPRALAPLAGALRSTNSMLGSAAAKALLRLNGLAGQDVFPLLADALPHVPLITQQTIVMVLPALKDQRAVHVLIEQLDRTVSPALRCAVIQALGEVGDPQAIPALRRYIQDEDRHVRDWAAQVLARLGDPPAEDTALPRS
jgi:HEAT repeat protein